jgi:hypothetical protein
MTKAQMMEMFDEDCDIMLDLLERLQSARDFFALFPELLVAAQCRLICSGSKALQEARKKG